MEDLFIGVDIGTSGVRAIAIDVTGNIHAQANTAMEAPIRQGSAISQDPKVWWQAFCSTLGSLLGNLPRQMVRSVSIDGTSGTLLLTDVKGAPLTPGLMYNDSRAIKEVKRIAEIAPSDSACHGASSALAKLLYLQNTPDTCYALHQADWIAGRLADNYGFSDDNNALKTGYDVVNQCWPDWLDELKVKRDLLPTVSTPGKPVAEISKKMAHCFGLNEDMKVVAGTTDGCAAFLATGASTTGDAVTSLGSTLVVKVLSDTPLFAPEYGIYSHRIGDLWLPGGASNTGGAALQQFFDEQQMLDMSGQLQPDKPTDLHYYPLPSTGERFPINDSELVSQTSPRPENDIKFFQGLLEGITRVEKLAYTQMQTLGAPYPQKLFSVGGGANNTAWTQIRKRILDMEMVSPVSTEAAYGVALLARKGVVNA